MVRKIIPSGLPMMLGVSGRPSAAAGGGASTAGLSSPGGLARRRDAPAQGIDASTLNRACPIVVLLCVLGLSACEGGEVRDRTHVTVRDSAGVSVVESQSPRLGEAERWTIDSRPHLSIGAVDGDDPYLLERVGSVRVLPDGRILVANRGDHTLRFFAPDGRFLQSAGRQGDGPGEFASLGTPYIRPDEIIVYPAHVYLSVERFDLEGTPIGSFRIQRLPAQIGAGVAGLLADGSPVLQVVPQGVPRGDAVPRVVTAQMAIYLISSDGATTDSLTAMPAVNYVDVGLPAATRQQFGPRGIVAVGDSLIYMGWTESREIDVVDRNGELVRVLRWDGTTRPLTTQEGSAWRREALEGLAGDEGFVRQRQQALELMVLPDAYPTFSRMLLSEDGWLWVQRYDPEDPPPVWDVFDPDGTWVTTVDMPAGLHPMTIGTDFVAGVWRDDLDVEFVRFHQLRRR